MKELNDTDKINLSNLLQCVGCYNQLSKRRHPSERDKFIRDKLNDELNRILKPPRGIEGACGPLQSEA